MALDTRTVMELRRVRALLERAMATYGSEARLVLCDVNGETERVELHLNAVSALHGLVYGALDAGEGE